MLAFTPWRKWKNIWVSHRKNVEDLADALSHLDIDDLKIKLNKWEEALTFLSGSESSIISNVKFKILIHASLIFKEQAKAKDTGLREKGLAQPHNSIQHIEGYDILCY
jgi:hypothetical protein